MKPYGGRGQAGLPSVGERGGGSILLNPEFLVPAATSLGLILIGVGLRMGGPVGLFIGIAIFGSGVLVGLAGAFHGRRGPRSFHHHN